MHSCQIHVARSGASKIRHLGCKHAAGMLLRRLDKQATFKKQSWGQNILRSNEFIVMQFGRTLLSATALAEKSSLTKYGSSRGMAPPDIDGKKIAR